MKETKIQKKHPWLAPALVGLAAFASAGDALAGGYDALNFKPANDQGYYLTVEQTQTLGRGGSAFGLTGEYSKYSLVLKTDSGAKIQNVVTTQVAADAGAAFGLADWLNVGLNVDGVPYQKFTTPGTTTQDNGARIGDIMVNAKARLMSADDYPVGIALVPFITFPTGSDQYFVGNNSVTGGGKVVIDTKRIGNRASFSLNGGGQFRDEVTLSPGAQTINDQFLYGLGMNFEVAKPVQLIAEVTGSTPFDHFFEKNHKNMALDGALRILPGEKQRVQITVGGGAGLEQQVAVPDWHVFTSVALRMAKAKEEPEPVSTYVEPPVKVITTNQIHFASGKSTIQSNSYPILDQISQDIKNNPSVNSVIVKGHTDSVGGDAYNQKLSQARANAIRTALVQRGVALEVTAVGMGESSPIADNTTLEGRAQNRRVEFHLQLDTNSRVKVDKKKNAPTYEEGISHRNN